LDLRGRKWREDGEDCIMRNFITCTLRQVKEEEMGEACSMNYRLKEHTKMWVGKFNEEGHSENSGLDGKITLERILWKWDGKVWIGHIWLRIGSSGWLL
jgi:hypothetical protein